MKLFKLLVITAVALASSVAINAAPNAKAKCGVTLPDFITDSMVIQQNAVITINGHAKKKATVKVTPSWDNKTIKAKADKDGAFTVKLNTPEAGGPYTITFDDGCTTVLDDVLVGDVWFCSGQSNMEMPVAGWGQVMDFRREVANANYPDLRLLQVQKQISYSPQSDTKVSMGGWRSASPQTVANFSAIGYFFGRDLQKAIGDTPIGIIDCTWGGTPIEAWSSYETLSGINEFTSQLETIANTDSDVNTLIDQYQKNYADWVENTQKLDIQFDRAVLQTGWQSLVVPGIWEDSVLPDFNGVVWLQREVDIPADLASKEAVLNLSVIDDDDVTYVNGTQVGSTVGYSAPRIYTIPAGVLHEGKNVISVRVADYQGGGGIWGDPDDIYLGIAGVKMPLTGKWNYKVSVDLADLPPMPISPVNSNFPTVLYNAMMHPLTVMPVKGVLWYQGCANVGNAPMYSKAFKAMITDWRKEWGNDDMPFYFVQLAGFLQPKRLQPTSQWAALRQAQADALELPHTGMAVAIDLGNPDDIHPKNKQEVARRLLNMALHNDYGRTDVVCQAPKVLNTDIDGRYVRLTFDAPVTIYDGGQGFILQSADGTWAQGYGRSVSPTVVEVSSDEIAQPVAIHYLWADYPEGDLRGTTGLPVAPF